MPFADPTSDEARESYGTAQERYRAKPRNRLRIKLKNYLRSQATTTRTLTLDPCAKCEQASCALAWRRVTKTVAPYCLEHLLQLERDAMDDRNAAFYELRYVTPGTMV